MDWKWVSLVFFIIGILCLPVWPYSHTWMIYSTAFCWFVAVLAFVVSIFSKRGSAVWRHRGQG